MMHRQDRSIAEAYLIRKAAMIVIEAAALSDMRVAEHVLAIHGHAVVSIETAAEVRAIELAGYDVPLQRLDSVIYALFSGALAEYRRAMAIA